MPDTVRAEELECAWPSCLLTGDVSPLISVDDRQWWCPTHIDDEFLPKLSRGKWSYCAACDQKCIYYLEETPLHPYCRRRWALGLVTRRPVGAYARRTAR